MADVEAETIILQGTFAARPAAAAALVYYVTTGSNAGKRYWSDGATWFEQPPTVETHVHAGADITSGTVADARIDAAIARDAEVTSAISTHAGLADPHTVYQLESAVPAAASQAEMEAGTEAALRAVSPLLVAQAIAALASAGSAPNGSETYLSADVVMVNATTWYSHSSLALTPAAGDYLAIGRLHMASASALDTGLEAKISTGGSITSDVLTGDTAVASTDGRHPASSAGGTEAPIVTCRVTVDGSTAVRLSGLSNRGSSDSTLKTTGITSGVANKASNLVLIKITSI